MSTKLVLVMIFFVGMLTLASYVPQVKANGTIYIRANGSVDPSTAPISSIDNITYTFTGNINDSIIVQRSNITIDGNGYTLQGTGSGTGLLLSDIYNITVKNTNVKNFTYGVYVSSSSCISIYENNITNNWYGIWPYYSSNGIIAGNNITNNEFGTLLFFSSFINISGNYMAKNNIDGIWVYYSSNNSVMGNIITASNDDGISLESSSNNTITSNNITESIEHGIALYESSNNSIYGNIMTRNHFHGIIVKTSSNNSVYGNNITANDWDGVNILDAANNKVYENTMEKNERGISVFQSSNYNNVYENNIANNKYGIHVWESSNYNSIVGNDITNNWYGIYLSYSSNNSIYHNNFVNNTRQAFVELAPSNIWDDDYPSGGNYWSDYDGVDVFGGSYQNEIGNDGIGDAHYTINANNTDNYPLMGMFSDFNATWQEKTYPLNIVSNSTVSNFDFGELVNLETGEWWRAIYFRVTGLDDTIGFCRILIPTALMNGTYKVFISWAEVPYTLLPCSNSTHSYLYFAYTHSTREVIIIPEFPSLLILPLFMMATLLAIIGCKRKHSK